MQCCTIQHYTIISAMEKNLYCKAELAIKARTWRERRALSYELNWIILAYNGIKLLALERKCISWSLWSRSLGQLEHWGRGFESCSRYMQPFFCVTLYWCYVYIHVTSPDYKIIQAANNSFENMVKFKCLWTTVTIQNCIQEEIKADHIRVILGTK
jgi:hypothetical protein